MKGIFAESRVGLRLTDPIDGHGVHCNWQSIDGEYVVNTSATQLANEDFECAMPISTNITAFDVRLAHPVRKATATVRAYTTIGLMIKIAEPAELPTSNAGKVVLQGVWENADVVKAFSENSIFFGRISRAHGMGRRGEAHPSIIRM